MDYREVLLDALRDNPGYADAYCGLGAIASPGERIKLPDGRTMGKREL